MDSQHTKAAKRLAVQNATADSASITWMPQRPFRHVTGCAVKGALCTVQSIGPRHRLLSGVQLASTCGVSIRMQGVISVSRLYVSIVWMTIRKGCDPACMAPKPMQLPCRMQSLLFAEMRLSKLHELCCSCYSCQYACCSTA